VRVDLLLDEFLRGVEKLLMLVRIVHAISLVIPA
jgi:hypothetical protein